MTREDVSRDPVPTQAQKPAPKTPDPDSKEELLDEAVEETFPASDPPATSPGSDIVKPADEEAQRKSGA